MGRRARDMIVMGDVDEVCDVDLFCHVAGLFCCDVGLFCRDVGLCGSEIWLRGRNA